MSFSIPTRRFCLRPVTPDDVDALHALWTEEPVRRFLWDGESIPRELTQEIVATSQSLFDAHGYGILAIREAGAPELLGFTGFWHFRGSPTPELLFGISPRCWSRGIATEAARRVMRYAFEGLSFADVDASTDAANAASIRVLDKLGMPEVRREVVDGIDSRFYQLTFEAWQRAIESGSSASGS